jgi:hypothetical protein
MKHGGQTHSATGAFIALRDEGSKVVGAVSSEKAIPYLAKIPRGEPGFPERQLRATLVTAAAADALGVGWQGGGIVTLRKRTGSMDQLWTRGHVLDIVSSQPLSHSSLTTLSPPLSRSLEVLASQLGA